MTTLLINHVLKIARRGDKHFAINFLDSMNASPMLHEIIKRRIVNLNTYATEKRVKRSPFYKNDRIYVKPRKHLTTQVSSPNRFRKSKILS